MTARVVLSVGALLLCAATLFAKPERERSSLLDLTTETDVPADQVEALVHGLSGGPAERVRVEATFLRVDASKADEILGEHRPGTNGSARVVPDALARSLLDAVRTQGAVMPEPLPPLVLFPNQTGRLTAGGHHTYLQDYDVSTGASPQARPVVGGVQDGACVEVRPRRRAKQIVLDVVACWAEVDRPIPSFETTLSSTKAKVTVELPQLRLVEPREQVTLGTAGGFVLAGREDAWDDRTWRLVVLEVRPGSG